MSIVTCLTEGCTFKPYHKGQCHKHYVRVGRPKPRPCSIDGCEKRAKCQELCDMHYTRLRRHNNPLTITNMDRTMTADERLRYIGWTETVAGCWEFNGPKRHGYGQINMPWKRNEIASRAAYITWVGEIAEGLFVCHECDNPACINPRHLFLGSHDVNMDDCRAKGRHTRGEKVWCSVLTEAESASIRALYASGRYNQYELASKFGTSQTNISQIVRRRTWKHVA